MNRRGFLGKALGMLASSLVLPKVTMPKWGQVNVEPPLVIPSQEDTEVCVTWGKGTFTIDECVPSPALGLSEPLTELFSLEIASESMLDDLGIMTCWDDIPSPHWEYWDGVKWKNLR